MKEKERRSRVSRPSGTASDERKLLTAACLEAYEMLEELAASRSATTPSRHKSEAEEAWRRIKAYVAQEHGRSS